MKIALTKSDAEEVLHKLSVLADDPDLHEGYGLTKDQADALVRSVPRAGGEWEIPEHAVAAVRGELLDHCQVLLDQAQDARSELLTNQARAIERQEARLRSMFSS
jgi:hypothetical protein